MDAETIRALATDPLALKRAADDQLASSDGAWAGGEPAVEGFLRRVTAAVGHLPEVVVENAEFGHYGSGYASYVDVFVTRRDGSARRSAGPGRMEVEGIHLLLCRLAPVATIFGPDERSSGPGRTGCWTLPTQQDVTTPEIRGWEYACSQVLSAVDKHGIVLLSPDVLAQPIDRAIQIDTNLGYWPYTVFDAWFHWMD